MKLARVSIHNFRGIHDGEVSLFDYNLLVGPNNAGKSTVIHAPRAFYEKDDYKKDGTLSDGPFYGAKNVQSGKIEEVFYVPAVSKVENPMFLRIIL